MKKQSAGILMITGLFLLPATVQAEVVQGQVAALNRGNNMMAVQPQNAPAAQPVQIQIPSGAEFGGIRSIDEISVGDEVRVSGERRGEVLEARRVDATGPAAGGAVVQEAQPGQQVPPAEATAGQEAARYGWQDKLSRGATNIITSPLEIPRGINNVSAEDGAAAGWTGGLVKGFVTGVGRFGIGALEVLTFPFDWPNNKAPLMEPLYPWQDWANAGQQGS